MKGRKVMYNHIDDETGESQAGFANIIHDSDGCMILIKTDGEVPLQEQTFRGSLKANAEIEALQKWREAMDRDEKDREQWQKDSERSRRLADRLEEFSSGWNKALSRMESFLEHQETLLGRSDGIYPTGVVVNELKPSYLGEELQHLPDEANLEVLAPSNCSTLDLSILTAINMTRVPLFKNSKGHYCHRPTDPANDWTPAQWLQAMVGEVGEYANIRKKFERGDISESEFRHKGGLELADALIYLCILADKIGVDLGDATIRKFNSVSKKVGADLYICRNGFTWTHRVTINASDKNHPTNTPFVKPFSAEDAEVVVHEQPKCP